MAGLFATRFRELLLFLGSGGITLFAFSVNNSREECFRGVHVEVDALLGSHLVSHELRTTTPQAANEVPLPWAFMSTMPDVSPSAAILNGF